MKPKSRHLLICIVVKIRRLTQSKNETVKLKNKGGKHPKERGVNPTTV